MRNTVSRRSFLGSMGSAPLLLLQRKTAVERPNVLFMASDDLNNSLGCYGNPIVKTPHLDALAARGVRFDRAYCQFAVCGPSRTSILSGLRPDSTQIFDNGISVRDRVPGAVTLPQLFRKHGYYSARFGKMYHMDVPAGVGSNAYDDPPSWDVAISPPGKEESTPGEHRLITPNQLRGNRMEWVRFTGSDSHQADSAAAAHAVDLINKKRDANWFIGLGFVRPHVPLVAPSRFFDLYPLSQMPLAKNPADDLDDIPKASEITITGRGHDMGMNEADKREAVRAYYASISYMDSLAGQVLSKVDLRKTIVVFWSDHGWHLGEHYRWMKRSLFEESARVPLIVAAPGRRGNGKSSRALVELVDIYPSLAELVGLSPESRLEGRSFVPLLDNPSKLWKSAAFTQISGPNGIVGRAVRTDRWRYIRWTGPESGEELYDHQADPKEFTNLAVGPTPPAALAEHRKILDAGWRGVT